MTERPGLANRTSTSKAPGSPLKCQPGALVSSSASITQIHPISIGSNAIVQLRCRLSSTVGPIIIGDDCIISERASIGSFQIELQGLDSTTNTLAHVTLGQGVLVESGATVEAASIGAFTVIETGAIIGKKAIVGSNCKICARVEIREGDVVEDNTVVFGSAWGERRVEGKGCLMGEKQGAWLKEQGTVLRRAWAGT